MGTATILGDTYQTVIMPDGNEWLAENYRSIGLVGRGAWWGDGTSNDGDGRYFYRGAANDEVAALPDGWRLPTLAEWRALQTALGGASVAGGPIKTTGTTYWNSPNTGATNSTGFSLRGAGYYQVLGGSWAGKKASGFYWASDLESDGAGLFFCFAYCTSASASLLIGETAGPDLFRFPMRLVRTYAVFHGFSEVDFMVAPEWGYEPKITPSLSWTKTASGLWRCMDDGAAFDAYDAEITVKVSGAVHSAWESFIAANRGAQVTYFAPAGVRPFGPHIDCTEGVEVVIGDAWSTDWRVGITADCYTLHIPMRYVGGYTPTTATIPAVVARKYPTPTWFYPTKVHATEAGTATAAPRDTETQTTQVIIDSLDQAGAAAMVNWCLYQRGASFTYTPTAGAYPFGVAAGNGPFTVRLIGWASQKPKPNRWDMTLDFAREA